MDWKPAKVIELYIRRWDIGAFHRELKQDRLKHLYQRAHESLLGTAKLSLLGALLLEISTIRSMESHLKIGKGTPGLRFRAMATGAFLYYIPKKYIIVNSLIALILYYAFL